jgi:sialate O-acetylesterase
MSAYQQDAGLKSFYEGETGRVKAAAAKYDPAKAKAAYDKKVAAWKLQVAKAKKNKKKAPKKPRMAGRPGNSNRIPSALYNGMVRAVVPYGIKGAIWYQGESNRRYQTENYEKHFSTLISSWRKVWGQGDFQFIWCQLAQFQDAPDKPIGEDGWVSVCDQQRLALKLPNTVMAVLSDIGEAKDIHPHNKVDAGKRLALWALAKTYKKDLKAWSGPLYKSSGINGSKVVITFDSVGSSLMAGKKTLLDPAVDNYFDGRIDDARIYNRALSATEIQAISSQGQ